MTHYLDVSGTNAACGKKYSYNELFSQRTSDVTCPNCIALMADYHTRLDLTPSCASRQEIDTAAHSCRGTYSVKRAWSPEDVVHTIAESTLRKLGKDCPDWEKIMRAKPDLVIINDITE